MSQPSRSSAFLVDSPSQKLWGEAPFFKKPPCLVSDFQSRFLVHHAIFETITPTTDHFYSHRLSCFLVVNRKVVQTRTSQNVIHPSPALTQARLTMKFGRIPPTPQPTHGSNISLVNRTYSFSQCSTNECRKGNCQNSQY